MPTALLPIRSQAEPLPGNAPHKETPGASPLSVRPHKRDGGLQPPALAAADAGIQKSTSTTIATILISSATLMFTGRPAGNYRRCIRPGSARSSAYIANAYTPVGGIYGEYAVCRGVNGDLPERIRCANTRVISAIGTKTTPISEISVKCGTVCPCCAPTTNCRHRKAAI